MAVAHDDSPPLIVTAGRRAEVSVDLAQAPVMSQALSADEMAAALAWRGRRVEFTRTALSEAIARFNGDNPLQITVVDPTVGSILISGVYWSDES